MINLTPKEMATTLATRAGAAMVELIIAPYHFGDWEYDPSGIGIDAKRLWLRGWCHFSVYVCDCCESKFGLFGVTSATVRTFLLGAALYTTAHYKDTACMTSSRTAVAKQTSSFLVIRERCLHARCLHYIPRGPPGSSALYTIVVSTILCYSVDGYTLGVCDIVAVYSQLPGCYTVPHPSYIRSSQWFEPLIWATCATQTVQRRQSLLQQRRDRVGAESAEEREARLQQMSTRSPVWTTGRRVIWRERGQATVDKGLMECLELMVDSATKLQSIRGRCGRADCSILINAKFSSLNMAVERGTLDGMEAARQHSHDQRWS